MKLRLKLFDAVVSPCVLFGLGALPMYATLREKVDITQRKMLRRIVGWRRIPDEPWDITMERMKNRVNDALEQWPIKSWSDRVTLSKWQHACRVKRVAPERWVSLACKWQPDHITDPWCEYEPYRGAGRPILKWDDSLVSFARAICHCKWHDDACNNNWESYNECYMRWCSS